MAETQAHVKIRGQAMRLPMGQINIRVPIDVYNAIQAYAQSNFRSLKSQCEFVLIQWAENNIMSPPNEDKEGTAADDSE